MVYKDHFSAELRSDLISEGFLRAARIQVDLLDAAHNIVPALAETVTILLSNRGLFLEIVLVFFS